MIRKLLFVVFALLCAPAGAEVYTWTDAQGNVHYSDKPVAGAQAVDVRSARTDPALIEAERRKAEEAQAAEAEAQQKAAEAEQESAAEAARRAGNCEKARVRLSAILGAQRPYRTSADGERHYLSSEEIDAEIREAEGGVAQWCGSE